jgi:hypothetical protein
MCPASEPKVANLRTPRVRDNAAMNAQNAITKNLRVFISFPSVFSGPQAKPETGA